MKKIIIISATSKSNFILSQELGSICEKMNTHVKIISLEDYILPLYTEEAYKKERDNYSSIIEQLSNHILLSEGIIICGPEYNGSIHPIITNAITWVTVSTDNWRDAFNNKIALICTSSGGNATKFIMSMRIQLEHLGAIVMPRSISISKLNPLNKDSAKKILNKFIGLL